MAGEPGDRAGFPWGVLLPACVIVSPAVAWLSIHASFLIHSMNDLGAMQAYIVPLFMVPVALLLGIAGVVAGRNGRRWSLLHIAMIGWLVCVAVGCVVALSVEMF